MYMYFNFYICFSCILNCIRIASDNVTHKPIPACPDLFEVTTLGHSCLVVSWSRYDENGTNVTLRWYPNERNSESKFAAIKEVYYKFTKHYKILWLEENTSYTIEIQNGNFSCWIEGKTIFKSNNSRPTKPDFNWKISTPDGSDDVRKNLYFINKYWQPKLQIEWLPCGRKGYCEGEEVPGSHFSVKYKQEWKTYEYRNNRTFLFGILPGRFYEIIVTSISIGSVDLETDSDPQEVFIQPVCSSIRSAKITTISNSSVLISWKPPVQRYIPESIEVEYVIFYSIFDSNPMVLLNYSYPANPYEEVLATMVNKIPNSSIQVKVSGLTPGTRYTLFIIPTIFHESYGFEYRIDYTFQTYQANLSLAKPEFHYMLHSYSQEECSLNVWWLPCGQEFDCKTNRPGSYFSIKYRNITDGSDWNEKLERRKTWTSIELSPHQTYIVSVKSIDEYNNSESSKEITIDTSSVGKDE